MAADKALSIVMKNLNVFTKFNVCDYHLMVSISLAYQFVAG